MPHSNTLCYEFGPFKFNVRERILLRDESVISLGEKATEVLQFLLQNAGELVSKEDLMKAVWPDSFVEESNLTQNIFTLRRALGDDRISARYIETVPRRGYRFTAAVKTLEIRQKTATPAGQVRRDHARSSLPPILAVLPFVNATGNNGLEYLADGVSDNLLNSLSQISKLRVMSRSSVFRYKGKEIEPKALAIDLKVDAMLVGKISSHPSGFTISTELVDCNGWLIWGDSLDCELDDILEIQDKIARQISSALRLKLTGEEQKRITTRYTDSSQAYQAYLEGRFHWSRYTRNEIEKAIGHFRDAIEIDPNFALAYAGIVDCYLRLATNYLPPENYQNSEEAADEWRAVRNRDANTGALEAKPSDPKVRLRHEWDWKGAEREIRRANTLRAEYPLAHQWYAAYLFARQLYQSAMVDALSRLEQTNPLVPFVQLTPDEEVQVFCAIAREQIDGGNYQGASLALRRWWSLGLWPKQEGLGTKSCADLLFTTGEVAGFVASAKQLPLGQKNAELLLSGSIALYEQLGAAVRASEGRIELALSYYRQGNFDLARSTFVSVLGALSPEDSELRCLALIRLASLERHAGRPKAALERLKEAETVIQFLGPWASGRHHLELASTYQELALSDGDVSLFDFALEHFRVSLYEFEAIGNLRLIGIARNNLGFLLLTVGNFRESEGHLENACHVFEVLEDKVRLAQTDDTLARLHLAEQRPALAEKAINRAIEILKFGDEDALLAEVLTTKGVVCCRLNRFGEATMLLESAHAVASRCGDRYGAVRALLIMIEEMSGQISNDQRQDIQIRLKQLSFVSQLGSLRQRLDRALGIVE